MQFAYLNQKWKKSSASFLFLNTGFQNLTGENNDIADGVFYRQTAGSYFTFPINKVKFFGSAYYQFGKANANTDLSAYQLSMEANYKPAKTLLGLGFEMLSGTDQAGDSKNKSFFPLYGTNHNAESMSLVKGGRPTDNTNNWAWMQLTVKPTLFKNTNK